jgi:hypothetical protein
MEPDAAPSMTGSLQVKRQQPGQDRLVAGGLGRFRPSIGNSDGAVEAMWA